MNSLQRQRMRRYGSNNHIEGIFRREKEIKQAVWEAKNDSRGHTGGGNSGHALVSDPTASAALNQVDEVREVTLPRSTGSPQSNFAGVFVELLPPVEIPATGVANPAIIGTERVVFQ